MSLEALTRLRLIEGACVWDAVGGGVGVGGGGQKAQPFLRHYVTSLVQKVQTKP